jgi:hypothetical protein
LSKEKAEKGKMYSLKYDLKKGGGGFSLIYHREGLLNGKRGNWKDYDSLNIKYVNMSSKPLTGTLLISDAISLEKRTGRNYVEKSATFQPGENVMSMDISTLQIVHAARPLDLENMRGLGLYLGEGDSAGPEEDFVIYILNVWVEKEEE